MKNCYVDYEHQSIVDLCDYGNGLMITRINVLPKHRGKGIGSKLLKQVCDDADKEKIILWLEILPSGPLDYDALKAWYERYGFKGNGIYHRKPKQ